MTPEQETLRDLWLAEMWPVVKSLPAGDKWHQSAESPTSRYLSRESTFPNHSVDASGDAVCNNG